MSQAYAAGEGPEQLPGTGQKRSFGLTAQISTKRTLDRHLHDSSANVPARTPSSNALGMLSRRPVIAHAKRLVLRERHLRVHIDFVSQLAPETDVGSHVACATCK